MPQIARCPRGQDVASYGRIGTCAKASAGPRVGTSGPKMGHAPRQGACAEAATLGQRGPEAGHTARARWAPQPAKGKCGGSWLTNLPVRALVGSHAPPPWMGRTVFAPQGAERVRPAPHATRQGCAGTRRTGRRAWRRRGTRPSPSAPSPCAPRLAWTRARARAEAAFERLRRAWAAPPPRLTLPGESSTRRQTFAEDGTRGRPAVEGAAANRHAALPASRSC